MSGTSIPAIAAATQTARSVRTRSSSAWRSHCARALRRPGPRTGTKELDLDRSAPGFAVAASRTLPVMKNSVALMLCVAFLAGCSGHGGVAAQPGVPAGSAQFADASIAPDALDPFSELPSYRYKLPTQGAQAGYVAVGSDGAVWFTEFNEPKIGRVDPLGNLTEYAIPSGNYGVEIAAGLSGTLWSTEIIPTSGPNPAAIGAISTSASITEYPVPNAATSQLQGIALGPYSNMWFIDSGNDEIGTITPAGGITMHAGIHLGAYPFDITAGPTADNDLWFTEKDLGRVGKITTSGSVTEFFLP